MSRLTDYVLVEGRRTFDDFLRHFPPNAITQALAHEPERRAAIVHAATGTKRLIAARRPAESCAEELAIALEVGETDAEVIVRAFDPDDRARFLADGALWGFLTEPEYWRATSADGEAFAGARRELAFLLACAREEELIAPGQIVDGITVPRLVRYLPAPRLASLLAEIVELGRREAPFTDAILLETAPIETIVNAVPLARIWDGVVVPHVETALGVQKPARASALGRVELQKRAVKQERPAAVLVEEVASPSRRDPRAPTEPPPES